MDWQGLYRANRAAIAAARANGGPVAGGATAPPGGVGGSSRRCLRELDPAPCPARATSARWFTCRPRLAADRPAPLVCMLHGCTQDPATFAAATLMNDAAERHGFVVVYPGQSRGSNPQGCWNWFLPEHQRRGAGEPAQIAGIVRDLIETEARCTIDPGRVFVAGLSSGGAMAAILAACYSDLFAAVAVHSGLPVPLGDQSSVRPAGDVAWAGEGGVPRSRTPRRGRQLPPPGSDDRYPRQCRPHSRSGQRRPGSAPIDGRKPSRGTSELRPRHCAPD